MAKSGNLKISIPINEPVSSALLESDIQNNTNNNNNSNNSSSSSCCGKIYHFCLYLLKRLFWYIMCIFVMFIIVATVRDLIGLSMEAKTTKHDIDFAARHNIERKIFN